MTAQGPLFGAFTAAFLGASRDRYPAVRQPAPLLGAEDSPMATGRDSVLGQPRSGRRCTMVV
ncbi:hypothetical protein ACGFX8_12145 [Streptomyces sp. NPDC048362]|uniref:hypothetical protein n=1 Tax=Streptomyces sp. NPDC048362 TaxID=3365539 RepID=UPI00371A6EE7